MMDMFILYALGISIGLSLLSTVWAIMGVILLFFHDRGSILFHKIALYFIGLAMTASLVAIISMGVQVWLL